jgi:Amt family ammonium transporter
MVGMLLTVFASKSVNSVVGDNEGLIFGDTTLFFKPIDCLSYSFGVFQLPISYSLL